MTKPRDPRSDLLLPALLLAAAAGVALVGGAIAWSRAHGELAGVDRQHGRVLAERIALEAGRRLANDDLAALDQLAADASALPGIRSVTIDAPSRAVARWTWPSDAAAAASCSNAPNLSCQSAPSSADMRRRTNGQPMAGAWD